MCGINGFTWQDESLIKEMDNSIDYRGPDDTGIYSAQDITLGHNRLSIIDLSNAGHQPMSDKEGNIWIVFNGEIYNFKEIRKRLEAKGYVFSSGTDTEVIIYAYKEYGAACVKHFNGMFAFAIWDGPKKQLFLARDRLGIKPLYYFYDGKNLIFSSELKAILKHDIYRMLDQHSLNSFMAYRFIPSERTMLAGIKKLLPGHYALLKDSKLMIKKYWDLSWNITDYSEKDALDVLEKLLFGSVERRLMADVPLGAFLSGGVDSSMIAAINSKLRPDPVKTFTVGFGHETDEFKHAEKVSQYLGTDHNELVLDYKDITRKLPKIIWLMDEPNSDITMVPLYFLSEFAKKQVTVVNTGEGADELFSGYQHYNVGSQLIRPVPNFLKKNVYSWYYSPFKKQDRKSLFNFNYREDNTLQKYLKAKRPKDFLNRVLKFDIKNELPNWQLTRVDRMTMAHGMEARVPFLDHNIAEFASSLPIKYKQPKFSGKYLLKKLALNYIPKDIVTRPKQGFTTPMHAWIKDNLEDVSEKMLFSRKKKFLNYDYIKKLIDAHKRSKGPRPFQLYSYRLLMLLFFDMWYEQYFNGRSYKDIEKELIS